jgi:hypothetical protein
MAVDTKAVAHNVIEGMSTLITHAMASRAFHSWHPSHSADDDDAKIERYAERVVKLRELRNKFEDLMFGVVYD